MKRCFLVVIDSLGVGEAPDADKYGDLGANTLSNVANAVGGVNLPTMEKLGFGKITKVKNMNSNHIATVGRLSEKSIGNDSTTGHWELAGLITKKDFSTYPKGFPQDLIHSIQKEANIDSIDIKISKEIISNFDQIKLQITNHLQNKNKYKEISFFINQFILKIEKIINPATK